MSLTGWSLPLSPEEVSPSSPGHRGISPVPPLGFDFQADPDARRNRAPARKRVTGAGMASLVFGEWSSAAAADPGSRLSRPAAGTTWSAPRGSAFEPGPVVACDHPGRMFGLAGLRVVDASLMSTTVGVPTNLTCLMIGERLATDLWDDGRLMTGKL